MEPAKIVISVGANPRNAPIIATIFTSPKPSPSRLRTLLYNTPINHKAPETKTAAKTESINDITHGRASANSNRNSPC